MQAFLNHFQEFLSSRTEYKTDIELHTLNKRFQAYEEDHKQEHDEDKRNDVKEAQDVTFTEDNSNRKV